MNCRSAYDRDGRRKYLTRVESENFLRQVVQLSKPEALFCLILYYTGCRISEALSLRRDGIDFQMNVVRIRCLKKRGRVVIRRVPIPEFLTNELVSSETALGSERLWQFSRTTGWRIIKEAMQKAQITGIHASPKGLRHGFGVRGALQQIPLNLIQCWMGHADLATTAIYLAVRDEEERLLIKRTW